MLIRNIRVFLDRERLRSNRSRIVEKNKQTEKPQPAAPAQGGWKRKRRSRTIPRSKPECKGGQDMLQVSGG